MNTLIEQNTESIKDNDELVSTIKTTLDK